MKLAVRFRYYKAVTPSLHLVELPSDEWRKFLGMEKPQERFDFMINFLHEERMRGYIKEMFWIPLEDYMELKVHRRKKEPKAEPIQPTKEQIEKYRQAYQAEIRRIVNEEVNPPYSPEDLETALNWLSDSMIIEDIKYGCSPESTASVYMTYN